MCGEEGRIDVQAWESIELIFSDCLGVNHDDSWSVGGVRVASGPFQSIEHVISRSISITVSVDIHIFDDQGLKQRSQQCRGWKVVSSADLGTARSRGVISVISQVFGVTLLWHPVRLGQQRSVALDRTIKDKLDSSRLVPRSVVIFQSALESTEIWAFLKEVPVDINRKAISESVVGLSKWLAHQILGGCDSATEVSIHRGLYLRWGQFIKRDEELILECGDSMLSADTSDGTVGKSIDNSSTWRRVTICIIDHSQGQAISHCDMKREVGKDNRMDR